MNTFIILSLRSSYFIRPRSGFIARSAFIASIEEEK
jgi:hypothetical protein